MHDEEKGADGGVQLRLDVLKDVIVWTAIMSIIMIKPPGNNGLHPSYFYVDYSLATVEIYED